ncbi:MAG TPA: hypothetical protein DCW44_05690 [Eubacterium sp.]|nr:hypothetical protein [Eubacterium sp.]
MAFKIINGDITKIKADAIVNTANPNPVVGVGVDSAIYEAAGFDDLLNERKKIGVLNPGEVAITSAFALSSKYIIHVSGPMWNGGNSGESDILKNCYMSALKLAFESGCKSIAFPLIATGFYGFPRELGMEIAVESFTKFLEDFEMDIILVVYDNEDDFVPVEYARNLRTYIGDSIDENEKCALPDEMILMSMPMEASASVKTSDKFLGKKLAGKKLADRGKKSKSAKYDDFDITCNMEAKPCTKEDLDEALKNIYTDSFAKHLQMIINKKGLKNSQVYAAANISKQYFSKLLNGKVNPSKEKVLSLAVGLRLNLDETIDLLKLAGYAFSPISQTDLVVKYFIENKKYNVIEIDIYLFDLGLDTLSGDVG